MSSTVRASGRSCVPERFSSSWEIYVATYKGRTASPELQARAGPVEWEDEPPPILLVIVLVYMVLAVVWEMANTPRGRGRARENRRGSGVLMDQSRGGADQEAPVTSKNCPEGFPQHRWGLFREKRSVGETRG